MSSSSVEGRGANPSGLGELVARVSPPVNLLSLDGGGIRGVCELVILDDLMARINRLQAKYAKFDPLQPATTQPLKPWQVFHLMGGTSTGGLIAIMLGRLRMTTQEALKAYGTLSRSIFAKKKLLSEYDPAVLESHVKLIVAQHTDSPLMRHPNPDGAESSASGLAFVCAVSTTDQSTPRLFRSYRANKDEGPQCEIWQAARATTAAPKYFPPMTIVDERGFPDTYIDGALGHNNPSKHVLTEALEAFGGEQMVGCLLSLGTGTTVPVQLRDPRGWKKLVPFNGAEIFSNLKGRVVDTEATHFELEQRFQQSPGVYFRLNVTDGAKDTGLDEFKKINNLVTQTTAYIRKPDISHKLETIAKLIWERSSTGLTLTECCGLQRRQEKLPEIPLAKPIQELAVDSRTERQTRTRGQVSDNFTGRRSLLERLNAFFEKREPGSAPRRHFLLFGIGGSGKTELALKIEEDFAARFHPIFWINASDPNAVKESINDLVLSHSIPNPQDDSVKAFLHWLSDLSSREEWLLIFDDCFAGDMNPYLPRGNHGNILFTSRHREMTPRLRNEHTALVGEMEPDEAMEFFLKAAELDDSSDDFALRDDAALITHELGYLPLAIDQAGAYIAKNAYPVDEYLELFRNHRAMLLRDPVLRGQSDSNIAVYTTFDLSYHCIESSSNPASNEVSQSCKSALKILNMFCFYYNEGLMEETVKRAAEAKYNRNGVIRLIFDKICKKDRLSPPQDLLALRQNGNWDPKDFREGVGILVSFSLLKRSARPGSYSMHSLVHTWARDRMLPRQRFLRSLAARILISDSCEISMANEAYGYDYVMSALSHFRACVALHNEEEESLVDLLGMRLHIAEDLNKLADLLSERGSDSAMTESIYQRVIEYQDQQLANAEELRPRNIISAARTKNKYGQELLQQGPSRFPDAEAAFLGSLTTLDRLGEVELGGEQGVRMTKSDIDTQVGRNLINLYMKSGRFEEAEDRTLKVLEALEGRPETKCQEELIKTYSMASTLYCEKRSWREAEDYAQRSLAIAAEFFPRTVIHSDAIQAVAAVRSAIGDNFAAEDMFHSSWKLLAEIYGDKHRLTIMAKFSLGAEYSLSGNVDQGWPICEEALQAADEALGETHKITLQMKLGTVGIFNIMKRHAEAASLARRMAGLCHGSPAFQQQFASLLERSISLQNAVQEAEVAASEPQSLVQTWE